MTTRDVPGIAAIETASFDAPWSEGILREELAAPHRIYLAAETGNGDLVGYAGLMVVEDDAHITTIAVMPPMRGLGVAKQLMVALVEAALEAGAHHLTLEVRESNDAAQALYERFGFSTVGRREGYYADEDAVVMWATNIDSAAYRARIESIKATTRAVV